MGDLIKLPSLVFHIVNLVILCFGLHYLLYKPVKKFMEQRQADYLAQHDAIAKEQKALALQRSTMENERREAQANTQHMLASRAQLAEQQAGEIIERANAEAAAIVARMREEQNRVLSAERQQMRDEAAELVVQVASQILGREVKPKDHQKLIEDLMNNVG